jgi:hypothetical protein
MWDSSPARRLSAIGLFHSQPRSFFSGVAKTLNYPADGGFAQPDPQKPVEKFGPLFVADGWSSTQVLLGNFIPL